MPPAHRKRSQRLRCCRAYDIGVNYLREHVTDDVRMHYAYMDNGIPAMLYLT